MARNARGPGVRSFIQSSIAPALLHSLPVACCLQPLDGLPGGDDVDALEAAQGQQIELVAGGDEIGLAGDGCGDDVIVVGIGGHDARRVGGRHHDRDAPQVIDDALHEPDLRQALRKLRPRQHIEQLGQQRLVRAKLELACLGAIEHAQATIAGSGEPAP